ncbi:MAG: BamA/TamA family outer membrane protein [Acidobacteria bacterium]|nr:BamA/TamA family outer membrane protein [Acidobacteriota bacterium]
MRQTHLLAATFLAGFFLSPRVCAQAEIPAPQNTKSQTDSQPAPANQSSVIRRIEFAGLRRIPAATVLGKIATREGQTLNALQIEADVRALDRLGWFDSVHAELEPLPVLVAAAHLTDGDSDTVEPLPFSSALRLIFEVRERPFLAQLKYQGSKVLSREQIRTLMIEKGIAFQLARPLDRTLLWRAARTLESALAEAGYPQAHVQAHLQNVPTESVRAVFHIQDGPRMEVARVQFTGNETFSEKKLRGQMQNITPGALLAGLRGKNIFTSARMDGDLSRLGDFYRNHGFADVKLGTPDVKETERTVRHWFPLPRKEAARFFEISIPVQEGTQFRMDTVFIVGAVPERGDDLARIVKSFQPNETYSFEKVMRARDALAHLRYPGQEKKDAVRPAVELLHSFDREAGMVRVTLRPQFVEPYILRRIELAGHHRFPEKFYRHALSMKEGDAFDEERLERGLLRLARGGWVHRPERSDLELRFDEAAHAVDLRIHIREIGQQRISLIGSAIGSGSTLGLAWTAFNLFGGQELIATHIEGGPENVRAVVSVVSEGLFGNRATLGLSLFRNIIRPRLPGAAKGQHLFTSRSTGLEMAGIYAHTETEAFGTSFGVSRTSTHIDAALPPELAGLPPASLSTSRTRSSVTAAWSHETPTEQTHSAVQLAGTGFGGNEDFLRSTFDYSRITADRLSGGRNSWAFHSAFAGSSTTSGGLIPLDARFFPGEDFLRGFRTAELSPYGVSDSTNAAGQTTESARPVGANFVLAFNGEYRMPVTSRTEVATFFDAGAGWLLPQWLGFGRPRVLEGTSGTWRASTGIEIRFTIPHLEQTLRFHYAWNPLRLARSIFGTSGSLFRGPDRRGAFGWALGSIF